jgi:signal transduction histidine kinase
MDDKLLRHILTHLLSNAIKYSPQDSPIHLELTCHPAGAEWENSRNPTSAIPAPNGQMPVAVFRIQDRGIGIPPEDLNRIFDTFQRATNAGTISGTGLGLAIVKRSVELHGGQISVESEVGAGTTFTVRLPLHAPSGVS